MAVDRTLVAHLTEELAPLGSVAGRAMFGGYGFWHDGRMFALLDSASTLYFKVNDANRAAYEAAGSTPFAPSMPQRRTPMTMPYYTVPLDLLDDGEQLREWARAAIEVAHASPPPRPRGRTRRG
ncbi:MAG: TfoX/Sxy family protein [Dehalococcoidia bacterium]|nr:TfoX/Sxy family protein [Dehalococcoidia bacterium]